MLIREEGTGDMNLFQKDCKGKQLMKKRKVQEETDDEDNKSE